MNKKFATHRREPFFGLASPYIEKKSKVLDIGPGSGSFSDFHSRNDFYLFEGNQESVLKLKEKHTHVHQGMLPGLPFEASFFDVIHCSHVIEHLEPQVFYDSLVEMDRCLAPGGVMVISTPLLWDGFYNDLSHVRPYNPKVFLNYLGSKNPKSRTRSVISNKYEIEHLQYRFLAYPLFEDVNPGSNLLGKLTFLGVKILRKLGWRDYKKTGYTVVLRKES